MLEDLITSPWRVYPALVLHLVGTWLITTGLLWLTRSAHRPIASAEKLLLAVRGFRLAMIGLALAGTGGAWLSHQLWLLAISLGIALVELLESSTIIWALRRESRHTKPHSPSLPSR